MKIRIKFAKEGSMRFIGHLDVMRYFQKVMRLADVDIRYSEGFSPHQIMSFAAPLGVGMESRGEYVDIEVLSTASSADMVRRINEVFVDGMECLSYRLLPDQAANAMSIVAAADYQVRFRPGYEPEDWQGFRQALDSLLQPDPILVWKKTKKGERQVDIRPMIFLLTCQEQEIDMRIAAGSAANLKPDVVIQEGFNRLGRSLPPFSLAITRTEVFANEKEGENALLRPLEDFGADIE